MRLIFLAVFEGRETCVFKEKDYARFRCVFDKKRSMRVPAVFSIKKVDARSRCVFDEKGRCTFSRCFDQNAFSKGSFPAQQPLQRIHGATVAVGLIAAQTIDAFPADRFAVKHKAALPRAGKLARGLLARV